MKYISAYILLVLSLQALEYDLPPQVRVDPYFVEVFEECEAFFESKLGKCPKGTLTVRHRDRGGRAKGRMISTCLNSYNRMNYNVHIIAHETAHHYWGLRGNSWYSESLCDVMGSMFVDHLREKWKKSNDPFKRKYARHLYRYYITAKRLKIKDVDAWLKERVKSGNFTRTELGIATRRHYSYVKAHPEMFKILKKYRANKSFKQWRKSLWAKDRKILDGFFETIHLDPKQYK